MSERETEEELQEAVELATGLGAGGRSSRGVPVIAPARSNVPSMLSTPVTSRTYSPYGAAQPASTLTARQALVNARRSTAANATDAGGHLYGRPAQPPHYPRGPIGSKKQYGVGSSVSSMNLARPLVPAVRAAMRAGGVTPVALTAAQSLARSLMQQAMPTGQHFGVPLAQAGATWARMKQGALLATAPGGNVYAGVTAKNGEQVAVAANAVNVGGYSNYYRQIWVKRGQTFDSSSWKTGWVHESALSISNVPAQWGQQGFGALEDQMDEAEMVAELTGLGAGASIQQQPIGPRHPGHGLLQVMAHEANATLTCDVMPTDINANPGQGNAASYFTLQAGSRVVIYPNPDGSQRQPVNFGGQLWVIINFPIGQKFGGAGWIPVSCVRQDFTQAVSAVVAPGRPTWGLPPPPQVPVRTPMMTSTRDLIDVVKQAMAVQNSPQPAQNVHQALVASGRPSDKLVDDFRNSIGGDACPAGQAVFGKYANGNIVQFDADWFNALKNNPGMRTGLVSLFCGWPHGQLAPPISPRGGFQHMQALRGLPEELEMATELTTGLGAGAQSSVSIAQPSQPLGPQTHFVQAQYSGGPFMNVWIHTGGNAPPSSTQWVQELQTVPNFPSAWNFRGYGYIGNDGKLYARGNFSVGQKTNIGPGNIQAHPYVASPSYEASVARSVPHPQPPLTKTRDLIDIVRAAGANPMAEVSRWPIPSDASQRGTFYCPPGHGWYLIFGGNVLAGPYSTPAIPHSGNVPYPGEPVGSQWKCLPYGPPNAFGQRAMPQRGSPGMAGTPDPEGFGSFSGENVMDEEMKFAMGLGSAMAMSSFSTHRALSPTAASAPCPTGYHPEQRLVAPGVVQTVCVPNPTALQPPAGGRGYSPYGAAPGGSPLTASMALRRAIMSTALPGDQRRAPPRSYGPPYQYGRLGVHGLPPEMEFAAGLGAMMVHGLGVIGPFGNTDAALSPGTDYQITGDGVYMWNGPQSNAGSISDANGKSIFLNTGDIVSTPADAGRVELDVGNGKYYALVTSSKAPNEPAIWVAVEYLAPTNWQKPAAPVAPPKPVQPPNAMLPAGKTDYTVPILVGAGVLGAGLIGYALYKRKKGHRHAH